MREEYLRTKIVGNLRDQNILFASSRSGYKFPFSAAELRSFVEHGRTMILPLINRIIKARGTVKLATCNRVDLLDQSEFDALRKLIDHAEKGALKNS